MKVLIVEDDVFLAKVYNAQFKKAGIETIVLNNGEKAHAMAKSENPDIIMLDLMLPPPKNGFEILEELKKDPKTKNIPVVILSMLGSNEDVAKTEKLGAIRHIPKTGASFHEVVERITELAKK
ncbi:MAG: response regulator [Candidatus Paceibacterota bacterium]|jgi:DNA-binding response OmpR family regulator